MNKYQEALETVMSYAKSYLIVNNYTDEGKITHSKRIEDKENELQELVDRATPKKPIEIERFDSWQEEYVTIDTCPNCGGQLFDGLCCTNNECRQAIDWEK